MLVLVAALGARTYWYLSSRTPEAGAAAKASRAGPVLLAKARVLQGLGILLLIAILVVYLVLGILYESFVHPLTILSGLPAAGLGALLTLLVFRVDLSLYAFVGIITNPRMKPSTRPA